MSWAWKTVGCNSYCCLVKSHQQNLSRAVFKTLRCPIILDPPNPIGKYRWKHLDLTLIFDFRTLIGCVWAWWDKHQKMFAAPRTTKERTRKSPQKTNAKTHKSWNLVVWGSFRIFFLVPKLLTFCERGRSAEIFPEMYMFGTKWLSFFVSFDHLLRVTFVSLAVVEDRS